MVLFTYGDAIVEVVTAVAPQSALDDVVRIELTVKRQSGQQPEGLGAKDAPMPVPGKNCLSKLVTG